MNPCPVGQVTSGAARRAGRPLPPLPAAGAAGGPGDGRSRCAAGASARRSWRRCAQETAPGARRLHPLGGGAAGAGHDHALGAADRGRRPPRQGGDLRAQPDGSAALRAGRGVDRASAGARGRAVPGSRWPSCWAGTRAGSAGGWRLLEKLCAEVRQDLEVGLLDAHRGAGDRPVAGRQPIGSPRCVAARGAQRRRARRRGPPAPGGGDGRAEAVRAGQAAGGVGAGRRTPSPRAGTPGSARAATA